MVMPSHGAFVCEHLEPLQRALREAGIRVGFGQPCPFEPDFGTWFTADCAFADAAGLRRRLDLEPCVVYEEYEGRLTPAADALFYCTCCRQAIAGQHPRLARRSVSRV